MSQNFRLDNIGLINRDKKISFKFNGKSYFGYEGDTLASALIANGVHLVGRSFKYHRPRGFFGSGIDESYAIVQLYRNNETDPNVRATEQELFEGLEAKSVNCWPSVNFDIGAINNFFNKFIPAGFYYKTFMWPKSFWYKVYEPFIRKAAGFGVASIKHDKERYEHKYEYCDLLITGSGPSGLASAYTAAKNGALALSRASVSIQEALVNKNGHYKYISSLKRLAYNEDRSVLVVSAGLAKDRPLEAQSDELWWGGGFSNLDEPYGTIIRFIRGFDPEGKGLASGKCGITLDSGAEGVFAALFSSDGRLLETIQG